MYLQNPLPLEAIPYSTAGSVSYTHHSFKRMTDILLSALGLVLLSPLLVVIGLAIRLTSTGPAIFKQTRVGARPHFKHGRVVWETCNFTIYKFRSMVTEADPTLHQTYIKAYIQGDQAAADNPDKKFKLTDDARITPVGRILRNTSLDELPQLLNVLKGDMSLVGPRPLPTYEVAEFQDWHRERLACRPGITGIWQVEGRCRVSFEEQIRMDIDYVRRQSMLLDFKLMVLTIPAVISGRGAG